MARLCRQLSLATVAVAVLSACASKPPPRWFVQANTQHLPMQGLPAAPHVVVDARPILIVNFSDAERKAVRDASTRAAIGSGVLEGASFGLHGVAGLWPMCVLVPPLCVGLVVGGAGVGAVAGGVSYTVVAVPDEDAARFAELFRQRAQSSALGDALSKRLRITAVQSEFPRLDIRIAAAVLLPTTDGVSFRLVAETRGYPAVDREWAPSIHFVQFPTRTLDSWRAGDGQLLQTDIHVAVRALAVSIAAAYLPYEHR